MNVFIHQNLMKEKAAMLFTSKRALKNFVRIVLQEYALGLSDCFYLVFKAFILTLGKNFSPVLGFSQSSQGPCNGSSSNCPTSDGHFDSSSASQNGGWAPDADPLDTKDYCGGGAYGPSARSYFAFDSAAF